MDDGPNTILRLLDSHMLVCSIMNIITLSFAGTYGTEVVPTSLSSSSTAKSEVMQDALVCYFAASSLSKGV